MLALSASIYSQIGASWWLFAGLFLAPDIAMLGYLKNPKIGARCYNLAHNYLAPAVLIAASWHRWELGFAIALIWAAHIGFDRMLGYGLKLESAFGHTHLNAVKAL